MSTDNYKEFRSFIESLTNSFNEQIESRWQATNVELYNSEFFEVVGGLLARQASLTTQFASNPGNWNAHIAPIILRCQTDVHITLAWILDSHEEREERAKKYILYGLGQAKLFTEHLESAAEEAEKTDQEESKEIRKIVDANRQWINSQRHDFLTEVNVGHWASLDTRSMAKEANCESLYKYAFTPFSAAVHSTWQHICMFNLTHCANPLHKYHRIPEVDMNHTSNEADYLYRSIKYLDKSMRIYDQKMDLDTSSISYALDTYNELTDALNKDANN
ncbi:MAG: DUF5677 domain-containing protein [Rhodospirillaceae bacterium]